MLCGLVVHRRDQDPVCRGDLQSDGWLEHGVGLPRVQYRFHLPHIGPRGAGGVPPRIGMLDDWPAIWRAVRRRHLGAGLREQRLLALPRRLQVSLSEHVGCGGLRRRLLLAEHWRDGVHDCARWHLLELCHVFGGYPLLRGDLCEHAGQHLGGGLPRLPCRRLLPGGLELCDPVLDRYVQGHDGRRCVVGLPRLPCRISVRGCGHLDARGLRRWDLCWFRRLRVHAVPRQLVLPRQRVAAHELQQRDDGAARLDGGHRVRRVDVCAGQLYLHQRRDGGLDVPRRRLLRFALDVVAAVPRGHLQSPRWADELFGVHRCERGVVRAAVGQLGAGAVPRRLRVRQHRDELALGVPARHLVDDGGLGVHGVPRGLVVRSSCHHGAHYVRLWAVRPHRRRRGLCQLSRGLLLPEQQRGHGVRGGHVQPLDFGDAGVDVHGVPQRRLLPSAGDDFAHAVPLRAVLGGDVGCVQCDLQRRPRRQLCGGRRVGGHAVCGGHVFDGGGVVGVPCVPPELLLRRRVVEPCGVPHQQHHDVDRGLVAGVVRVDGDSDGGVQREQLHGGGGVVPRGLCLFGWQHIEHAVPRRHLPAEHRRDVAVGVPQLARRLLCARRGQRCVYRGATRVHVVPKGDQPHDLLRWNILGGRRLGVHGVSVGLPVPHRGHERAAAVRGGHLRLGRHGVFCVPPRLVLPRWDRRHGVRGWHLR